MFKATHTANPVRVNAAAILNVTEQPGGNLMLRLSYGRNYEADTSMTTRYFPVAGDYLVTQEDGYQYLNRRDLFERKYGVIAPVHNSDCSLHNEPAMPAGPCDCSVSSMTFGQALEAIKRGQGVGRTGWNGKGMWIGLHEETGTFVRKSCGTELQYRDYIVMKTVDNELVPWVASQTDLLAEDWQIVE